jgi:hypothetical protein
VNLQAELYSAAPDKGTRVDGRNIMALDSPALWLREIVKYRRLSQPGASRLFLISEYIIGTRILQAKYLRSVHTLTEGPSLLGFPQSARTSAARSSATSPASGHPKLSAPRSRLQLPPPPRTYGEIMVGEPRGARRIPEVPAGIVRELAGTGSARLASASPVERLNNTTDVEWSGPAHPSGVCAARSRASSSRNASTFSLESSRVPSEVIGTSSVLRGQRTCRPVLAAPRWT